MIVYGMDEAVSDLSVMDGWYGMVDVVVVVVVGDELMGLMWWCVDEREKKEIKSDASAEFSKIDSRKSLSYSLLVS
jgi:hypothetical protein